jgi:hypothetical protein
MTTNTTHTTKTTIKGGVSFLELLQLALIVLKLCKIITWSWWWVLAPTWIPILILIVVVGIVVLKK